MDELVSLKTIIYTLLTVGIFQSVIFSGLMYNKKQYFLATWLTLFSFEMICKLLLYFKIALPFSQWMGFWFTFDIIYGPLLLLWIIQLLTPKALSRWHLLHFFPAVIYSLLVAPEVFTRHETSRLTAINAYLDGGQWAIFSEPVQIFQSLTLWHPLFYSLCALVVLIRYRQRQKKNNGSTQLINSSWLLHMVALHIIMWFSVIIGLAFIPLPATLLYLLSYLPTIVWINLMTYLSLSYLPFTADKQPIANEKYSHNKLQATQLQEIADQLKQEMQQGIFCQSRLTLSQLSEKIDVPSHYVSQVINEFYQCNFFDFVNSHRLQSIKKQLHNEQYQTQTILEIALENGFNSKSTFNTAFKKDTGLTPSQYRKKGSPKKCEVN